jgi:hypothetical protein
MRRVDRGLFDERNLVAIIEFAKGEGGEFCLRPLLPSIEEVDRDFLLSRSKEELAELAYKYARYFEKVLTQLQRSPRY